MHAKIPKLPSKLPDPPPEHGSPAAPTQLQGRTRKDQAITGKVEEPSPERLVYAPEQDACLLFHVFNFPSPVFVFLLLLLITDPSTHPTLRLFALR